MTNSNKWKKCPKCNGFIPTNWAKHDKCGWIESEKLSNSPQETKVPPRMLPMVDIRLSTMVMSYVKDLVCAGKVKYEDFEKAHKRLMGIVKDE